MHRSRDPPNDQPRHLTIASPKPHPTPMIADDANKLPMLLARMLTTVPPPCGPLHGCTSDTRTDTTSTHAAPDAYSRPLLLTSTRADPDDAAPRVELHTHAPSPDQRARRTPPPTRQTSHPTDSDDDEKPTPRTVTGVPPSEKTRAGEANRTDAARWYVNDGPDKAYC